MIKKRSLLQGNWESQEVVIPANVCVLGPFLQRRPGGFLTSANVKIETDLALLDTQKQRAVMIVR